MSDLICMGVTKSGISCRGKAGGSGYCPVHDPALIAKREKDRQAREAAEQAAQTKYKPLREVINVMRTTCEGKDWQVFEGHFDYKKGRHASLEIRRFFKNGGNYDI